MSFKRKVKASDPTAEIHSNSVATFEEAKVVTGWKPWIHTGLGMVSCGHRQLDDLLFGGIPLGSIMLYELEAFSNYGGQLFAYNAAEGISHRQSTMILTTSGQTADDLIESLPYNQNVGHSEQSNGCENSVTCDDESSLAKKDWGLKIAWQYEKYLKTPKEKSSQSSLQSSARSKQLPYCCSYDLSRRLQFGVMEGNIFVGCVSAETLSSKFAKFLQAIKTFLSSNPPNSVSRIYVPNFHEVLIGFENDESFNSTLGKFILNLKMLIRDSKVAVFLSMKVDAVPKTILSRIEQLLDIIVTIESFSGRMQAVPYEFRDYLSFFIIKKLHYAGMMATPQPKASKFGIKRDRRKLHIEPLHLPPEESRAFGSSCSDSKSGGTTSSREKTVNKNENATVPSNSDESPAIGGSKNKSLSVQQSETINEEKPKSSLATALAAAKAQRAAQSKGSSGAYLPSPISISKKASAMADKNSLEF